MSSPVSARNRESGSALLEVALILPVFLLVVYAFISFGLAMTLKEDITHAAAEAARAAIGAQIDTTQHDYFTTSTSGGVTTCTTSATYVTETTQNQAWCRVAFARAKSVVAWAATTPTITPSISTCPSDVTNTCISVAVSYNLKANPLMPNLMDVNSFDPSTLSSTAVVQVQ